MAVTPDQVRAVIEGLRDQPDLLVIFKKAMWLEDRTRTFHPQTYST